MAYKDFVNDRKKGILKDVLLFYGAEDFLIPAMIVIALALTLMHKKGGAKHE